MQPGKAASGAAGPSCLPGFPARRFLHHRYKPRRHGAGRHQSPSPIRRHSCRSARLRRPRRWPPAGWKPPRRTPHARRYRRHLLPSRSRRPGNPPQLVRVVTHDFAILAGARFGLVGIDHEVMRPAIAPSSGGMKDHLSPVGNPAPPRPRRPDALTSSIHCLAAEFQQSLGVIPDRHACVRLSGPSHLMPYRFVKMRSSSRNITHPPPSVRSGRPRARSRTVLFWTLSPVSHPA